MRGLDRGRAGEEVGWVVLPAVGKAASHADSPIVLVSGTLQAGGAERQFVNLAKGLAQRQRCDVRVFVTALSSSRHHSYFLDELIASSIDVQEPRPYSEARCALASSHGAAVVAELERSLEWAPHDQARTIIRLVAEFDALQPKSVAGWQDETAIVTGIAGAICGISRIVISTRNLNPSRFDYHRPFMAAAYQRLSREPQVAMTNNSEAGARDYEAWLGLDQAWFRVVRNGIDEGALRPAITRAQARAALGCGDVEPIIGGIFRLAEEKQPLLWLDVASRIAARRPEARFVHVGSGALREQFEKRARRLGLAQRLISRDSAAPISSIIAGLDVLLLTSAYEGTPNVVLEAALCGVPSVALAAGGVSEAMEVGVTGYLVSPPQGASQEERATAVAAAVLDGLSDDLLRRSVREAGPEFVRRRFGMARMVEEFADLLTLDDCR